MAVAPIQYQQQQAFSGGADFSQLSKLGDIYRNAQAEQRRQTALGMLGGDPNADAATLLRSGDPGLVQLGINMRNRSIDQQREDARYAITDPRAERQLSIQEQQDKRAANADVRASFADQRDAERLKLLQEKAARENRSLEEVVGERHQAWVSRGLKPEGPAYKEWLFNEEVTNENAAGKASLSPVYGTRKNEKGEDVTVAMQPTGTGEFVESKLPPGVSISNKPIAIDRGTTIEYMDPITKAIIKTVPKDLSGAAEQKQTGEDIAKAKAAIPTVELNEKYLLKNIDDTVSHPGKQAALGWKSYFPTAHGSEAHGFEQRLNQTNQRAFLQAYETLRGAGQISEREGQAATAALSRASKAQNVKEFDDAMAEFRSYVIDASNAARRKAAGNFASTGQGTSADDAMAKARIALDRGADPKAVRSRLLQAGVDPGDIGK